MKTLLLFFVLFITLNVPIKASHYYFKQISLKDGLPTIVKCICTEERGFVWIGGPSGLGRFDGHELKKYMPDSDHPNSLPDQTIYRIIEDKQHNLWILTKGGIARYRPETDDFEILRNEKGHEIIAYSACLTDQGILFGAINSVYQYNYQSKSISLLTKFTSKEVFPVSSIIFWDKNTLLCSSQWLGMILVDITTGKTTQPPFDCGKEIDDVFVDSKNRIWVAPNNGGIACFTHEGTLLASYTTQNSALRNNSILCITENNSEIWMGTDGGGIHILNPETRSFKILEHIPGDSHSLPVNSICYLHNDQNNHMWAGTVRGGMISIREASMITYTDSPINKGKGLSDNTVLCLYQDSPHKIWIGTDGGGINSFNSYTNTFNHDALTWGEKVVSISGFTPNELLLSLFNKGIYIFNKATGTSRPLTIVNKQINDQLCLKGKTVHIHRNTDETVLMMGKHIYRYTIRSKQFDRVTEEKGIDILGTPYLIGTIQNRTYLYDSRHIYRLDHQDNALKTVFTSPKNTTIYTITLDKKGVFWIGSNHGLGYYDPEKKTYRSVTTNLFKEVKSLMCDQQDKLWIGADGMLFVRLPNEGKFTVFGELDGVIVNEYLNKARLISIEGDAYMGGVNGLLRIEKEFTVQTAEDPLLQLVNIEIDGKTANETLAEQNADISVPWDTKIISIKVMAREQDIFRKKIYRYQIAGLNNQTIDSYNSELIIRSLPPGNYKIKVSCSTKNGEWTPVKQILSLTVMLPWYQSWWFILGCIFLVTGVILQMVFITIRRKEEKLKWAMKEHEQQVYEEKVRFLINISHEIRTPLTLIYGSLSRILKSLPPTDSHYTPLASTYRQAQRIRSLINMVLDLRKMEVGGGKLRLHPQDLNEWILQVSKEFMGEAQSRGIQIVYQLEERVHQVSFDTDKCEIILTNLLTNALKHSPDHSTISISSELVPANQKVRISISDQGCGLKGIDTHQLFTRFYQGSNEHDGTGIGLSYSKILVELHGGTISAKENKEAGATFYFELPLKTDEKEIVCQPKSYLNGLLSNGDKTEQSLDKPFNTEKYSLLVVDDNEELVNFLKESLEEQFKKVFTAQNGMEAMDIIKHHQPDIVVSDVMMPLKDGYTLCSEIKQDIETSHIIVVLLTACGDQQGELYSYKYGADAYLPKPFDIEMLEELLRSRLRNREYIKTRYQHIGPIPIPEEGLLSQIDESFMIKLNKVITDHLENTDFDITTLCKELGISRSRLYAKLKILTDMGVNDYINKLRLEKAIQLIATTDWSFSDIALKTGFSTSRYFSTAFKQYTGETPTQYKERTKEKNN